MKKCIIGFLKTVGVVLCAVIVIAAALLAYKIAPESKNYMIASHSSVETGHKIMLEYMGLKPILYLELRLGEGTGAAIAMNIVECSLKVLNEMATFKDAGVSEKK